MASSSKMFSPPVLALLTGALMWGVIWYPMRLLEQAGIDGLWLTLLIYLAALIASLPYTYRYFKAVLDSPAILIPLAIAAGWTNVAFVLAILDGNIMRVLLLFYLSPLWAVLLGYAILAERPSVLAWTMLLVAMVGALFMLWNPESGVLWPHSMADWLAITSGMAFAISNVLIRKGQQLSLAAKVGVSWVGVIGLALLLIIYTGESMPVFSYRVLLGGIALGVGGILVMTALVQYGVSHMPVHRSAVILLFELVAGAISQYLLTAETLSVLEWSGGILIAAAACMSARS